MIRILRWVVLGLVLRRFKWLALALTGLALARRWNEDRGEGQTF